MCFAWAVGLLGVSFAWPLLFLSFPIQFFVKGNKTSSVKNGKKNATALQTKFNITRQFISDTAFMSRQTLTWLGVLKGNIRGCYNEWAFNRGSKMLLKGVWKMMLALEKYFWKNNKNKKTTERIYIPSRLLDCDSAAAGSLDVLDVTKSKYWCNISV